MDLDAKVTELLNLVRYEPVPYDHSGVIEGVVAVITLSFLRELLDSRQYNTNMTFFKDGDQDVPYIFKFYGFETYVVRESEEEYFIAYKFDSPQPYSKIGDRFLGEEGFLWEVARPGVLRGTSFELVNSFDVFQRAMETAIMSRPDRCSSGAASVRRDFYSSQLYS